MIGNLDSISIIGAGWLGLPLAQSLLQHGLKVSASSRNPAKLKELTEQNIQAHPLDLNRLINPVEDTDLTASPVSDFFKADCVLGCFPPGFRRGGGEHYLAYWQKIVELANLHQVKRLVMISSTAVYPEKAQSYQESDLPLTQPLTHLPIAEDLTEKGKKILAVEQWVVQHFKGEGQVLRLAGLFGDDRAPANFVKRMKTVSALAPANMVHKTDVVRAIRFLLLQAAYQPVVNINCPEQVTKQAFYQAALDRLGAGEVISHINQQPNKWIKSDLLQSLGFKFTYSSPIAAIE